MRRTLLLKFCLFVFSVEDLQQTVPVVAEAGLNDSIFARVSLHEFGPSYRAVTIAIHHIYQKIDLLRLESLWIICSAIQSLKLKRSRAVCQLGG